MLAFFYKNFVKKKNSTKRPDESVAYDNKEVVLKANTSKENPVFIITGNIETEYNYVLWNRHYYYISDIVSISNTMIEVHCSQDILATYRDEIGNTPAFVERSESNTDPFVYDNAISVKQSIVNMSHAETQITGIKTSADAGCYVCRIAGGSLTGINTYVTDNLEAFAPIFNRDSYVLSTTDPYQALGLTIFNPFDYVVSLSYMPIPLTLFATHGVQVSRIAIKWFDISVRSGYSVYRITDTSLVNGVSTLNIPTNYYDDFRKYSNQFSMFQLYLPAIGTNTLPAELTKYPLQINSHIDLITGDIFYNIKALNQAQLTDGTVMTMQGNLSTPIQIGSDAFNISSVIKNSADVIATMSASQSLVSGITAVQNLMTPPTSINGTQGSGVAVRTVTKAVVTLYNYDSCESPIFFAGKPCNKNLFINTLTGYVKCGNGTTAIAGLERDADEINAYLNSGFYFE